MTRFRAINDAIKKRDGEGAAVSCNRKGPSADRNTFTRKRFRKAGALEPPG